MPASTKPAAIRIRLPYQTVDEFSEGYRHHLSRAAAFVATESPRTVGTILAFEFVLQDGTSVLKGEAVVAKETRPQSRPGMLLRFLSLDDACRDLLERTCPVLASGPTLIGNMVLGIDFGNRTVRAALARQGKAEVLKLGREQAIPAAVAMDVQGRLVVGAQAQALIAAHPDRVVIGPKRFLGRPAGPESAALTARLPYPVVADARGELAAVLGSRPTSGISSAQNNGPRTIGMTQLAAELLRMLKERAQESLQLPVQRAVLAVPAHFGNRQRAALRRAAQEAGFSVDRLINETTAVALACGAGAGLARRRLAIVDLGGGSFNCAVVQIEGDEVEAIAAGGDSLFGGVEFEIRFANWLAEHFETESAIDVVDDAHAFQRLREAAGRAMIELLQGPKAEINLPVLAQRDGKPVDFKLTVTREDFEKLTEDLVDRAVHLTGEVLSAGKIQPKACDDLVLVGHLSTMPLLRKKLSALFGREPRKDVNGETVVARGAALLGHSLTQREQGLGLQEVLSGALFVELPNGDLRQVFERHTVLPADRHLTLEERTSDCRIRIHQGVLGNTETLGSLEVGGSVGKPQLQLTLSVDGLLQARLKVGDQERTLEIAPADARSELPLAIIEADGYDAGGAPSPKSRLPSGAGA